MPPLDVLDGVAANQIQEKQREHAGDEYQDFHAQCIGSSSAPVQPPQERLEFLAG